MIIAGKEKDKASHTNASLYPLFIEHLYDNLLLKHIRSKLF